MAKSKSKTFFYRRTINIQDNEDVRIKIEYPDAGTTGHSFINVPGDNDIEIIKEGEENIGIGSGLKSEDTIITSSPVNLRPETKNIRENIYVNGVLTVEHNKPKSVTKDPMIVVLITIQ